MADPAGRRVGEHLRRHRRVFDADVCHGVSRAGKGQRHGALRGGRRERLRPRQGHRRLRCGGGRRRAEPPEGRADAGDIRGGCRAQTHAAPGSPQQRPGVYQRHRQLSGRCDQAAHLHRLLRNDQKRRAVQPEGAVPHLSGLCALLEPRGSGDRRPRRGHRERPESGSVGGEGLHLGDLHRQRLLQGHRGVLRCPLLLPEHSRRHVLGERGLLQAGQSPDGHHHRQ